MVGPGIGPAALDWRNTANAISSPGDQQKCNACSSFAVAAAIGAHLSIAAGQIVEVSAGYLHTCLGNARLTNPDDICNGQVDLNRMVQLVRDTGYALAAADDYPFPPSACPTTSKAGQISAFTPIGDADDAKSALVRGPIVADMYIWRDFFDYTTARAPTYVPDLTRGNPEVHSVCVIGFNAQGWLIKNSMGPAWGDGSGFAVIAYHDCMLIEGPDNPPDGLSARETFAIEL